MNSEQMTLVMIPREEWTSMKEAQESILQKLNDLRPANSNTIPVKHITAKEFMATIRICRSKFDQLVLGSKIKTIKKRRKIYVPVSEIDRYFSDPAIQ